MHSVRLGAAHPSALLPRRSQWLVGCCRLIFLAAYLQAHACAVSVTSVTGVIIVSIIVDRDPSTTACLAPADGTHDSSYSELGQR